MARPAQPGARKFRRAFFSSILIVGIVVVLAEALGWPFLRLPVESLLANRLARPVRIDTPFHLHFLGTLRMRAGGLWVAAPAGFNTPHFISAQDVDLTLRYADLWASSDSAGLRIAALKVSHLDAELLRKADGSATWQLGEGPAGAPPHVDELNVHEGRLVLRDAVTGADLFARFDTREGEAAGTGESHLAASGRFGGKPLRAELTTAGLLPVAGGGDAPLPARGWAEYAGLRVDFDGHVAELSGAPKVEGAVTVKGPSLALLGKLFGVVLPTTAPFTLKGRVAKSDAAWNVEVAQAHIGASQLSGHFVYTPRQPRPVLTGELHGERFVLADLAPAFGTRNQDGEALAPPSGRALPDRPLDIPALKEMDAAITIDLAHLDLGKAFSQPIAPFKGQLSLEDGRLALQDVDARTARGSLGGSIAVDANHNPAQWQADLAWSGIRLEDWLKVSRSRRGDTGKAPPPYFTGNLEGRAQVRAAGNSTARLLASLDGEGTAFVRKGSMSHLVIEAMGLDMAQALGLILSGDEDVPLTCAVVRMRATHGQVSPSVALFDTPVTLVLIDGSADLAREALNLRLVAKPHNFSPFTARSPLWVRGSFVDPKITAETGPIAARIGGGLLLGMINPLAAVLPFIDPGGGDSGSPCAATLASLQAR